MINSEAFSTCDQNVNFTLIRMHGPGKRLSNKFLHVAHMHFLHLLIREHISHACSMYIFGPRW